MECIKIRLLEETVKFIDICQTIRLQGKISNDIYIEITSVKFSFIDKILNEDKTFFIDNKLNTSIKKVYQNDSYIHSLKKETLSNTH